VHRLNLKVALCLFVRTRNNIEQVRGTYLLRGTGSGFSAFDRQGVQKKGGSDGRMIDSRHMGKLDDSPAQSGEQGQTCGCICIGYVETLCGSTHW